MVMTANGTSTSEPASREPTIIREPRVYLVGRQVMDRGAIDEFLDEYGMTWETDTEVGGEQIVEAAGRICYLSFGKGRKTNKEYIDNLMSMKHGSVLEHAVWDLVIAGVSRSFSHELVRHRAGFGYSQLSQRYVDESMANFVEPEIIAKDPAMHGVWLKSVKASHAAYVELVEGLAKVAEERAAAAGERINKTHLRKQVREAARSVLPNATETMIFVSANARALRHFIELRGSEGADAEIRRVAVKVLRTMQGEAPTLFEDYVMETLPDGSEVARTDWEKV
jgi:thymidylate synthase (FAD)